MNKNFEFDHNLLRLMIESCKASSKRLKVVDSTGAKLTGGEFLMRLIVVRRLLQRLVLSQDEQYVGILLPPSVPAAVVNAAVSCCGKVAVNLNYTVSSNILNQCIALAGIRHVLTSRKVMEKLDMKLDAELVYMEDLKDKTSLGDKLAAVVGSKILPVSWLANRLGADQVKPDDVQTVIFTSGSTGVPKGVVLTYKNIASNVAAINEVVGLTDDDVFIGVLPFFHSFGYTVTLWTVLASKPAAAYHFNPLDARQIGKLAEQFKATILFGTPTFIRNYTRRVERDQFKTLEVVVVGAEKLPHQLSDAFEEAFGIRPIEGYGTTELSPIVSVNIPPSRSKVTESHRGSREGSVGRCVPGVEARVVSLDDSHVLPIGESGMLQIKGLNVMQGYLKQPELTAKVLKDGWYETGDVAMLDSDGFIHITGRQSRFSKIGGEMVPHIQIEEEIHKILGIDEEGTVPAVVCAVPDPKRGERLVVLYTELSKSPSEILKRLSQAGLPNLFLPSEDSFAKVEAIPILGTGKLDLRGMQQLAREKFGIPS